MRRIVIVFTLFAVIGAGVVFVMNKRADVHHSAERRAWKDRAVAAIRRDLKDAEHLKTRFGKISGASDRGYLPQSEWKTSDTILCGDGSWLAYRAHCHKEGADIHDIFVGKGSDGRWYYSDYHFCVSMMMVETQPLSLQQFEHQYFLMKFNGTSDKALEPTWIPVGPRREEIDSSPAP